MSEGKLASPLRDNVALHEGQRDATGKRAKRRGWSLRRTPVLAALFVLLATGGLAAARYSLSAPIYVATQTLAIVVTPPNSSTSISIYEQSLSAQQTIQVAQLLTTPTFLTSNAFESDVTARLQGSPGDATTRAATSAQVGQALIAQQAGPSGAEVTLTARWATAIGAQAILTAATAALQCDATQLAQAEIAAASAPASPTNATGAPPTTSASSAPVTPPLAAGELISAQAVGAATTATRDAATMDAARTRLYEQLALALLTALLLGGALQWALTRRR